MTNKKKCGYYIRVFTHKTTKETFKHNVPHQKHNRNGLDLNSAFPPTSETQKQFSTIKLFLTISFRLDQIGLLICKCSEEDSEEDSEEVCMAITKLVITLELLYQITFVLLHLIVLMFRTEQKLTLEAAAVQMFM